MKKQLLSFFKNINIIRWFTNSKMFTSIFTFATISTLATLARKQAYVIINKASNIILIGATPLKNLATKTIEFMGSGAEMLTKVIWPSLDSPSPLRPRHHLGVTIFPFMFFTTTKTPDVDPVIAAQRTNLEYTTNVANTVLIHFEIYTVALACLVLVICTVVFLSTIFEDRFDKLGKRLGERYKIVAPLQTFYYFLKTRYLPLLIITLIINIGFCFCYLCVLQDQMDDMFDVLKKLEGAREKSIAAAETPTQA